MDETGQHCSNIDCQVSTSGKCADGHDPLLACPNYLINENILNDSDELDDQSEPTEAPLSLLKLPSGELLRPEELEQFLLWRKANMVALIGDSNSGKTTLLCALYDRLLRGAYAGFEFVSSRTLMAFERRIYPSRIDSGRPLPDTPRTSIAEGLRYFHLAIAPTGFPNLRTDLMISDRAGETYRAARNDTTTIAGLSEIPRCDTLAILLDGERVADPTERTGAIHGTRQLLRALFDNGAVDQRSFIQLVTTKYDCIASAADQSGAEEAIAFLRERIASDFGSNVSGLTFHNVAARDPNGRFDAAFGLSELFREWGRRRSTPPQQLNEPLTLTSEFDRLALRTPEE